ncbi:MAG: leucine-rich repeat domain-containing protein [Bacteroidetes bacterium]|nr:leucine-rich repeat domain-containing protein [Bacteroidota bacterium]
MIRRINKIYWICIIISMLNTACDDNNRTTVDPPSVVFYSLQDALDHSEDALELRLRNIGDSLAPEIGLLPHLYFLRIDDSDIRYLPDEITALRPQLQFLYMPNCQFDHIPPQICTLSGLSHLILDGNTIESLPEEFVQLKQIDGLSLVGNRLREFTRESFASKDCLLLALDSNRLTSFDFTRADLPRVNTLSLVGNPLPDSVKQRLKEEFGSVVRL